MIILDPINMTMRVKTSVSLDRFHKNLASMGAAQLAQRLSRLLTAIVLSRLLDAESFGLAAIALTVYEFVALFTRNGIAAKVVQASEDAVQSVAETAYWMTWIVCLALIVLQSALAVPLSWVYHDQRLALPIALMGLIYLASPLSNIQGALLQREGRLGRIAVAGAAQVTVDNILTAGLAYAGFGMWSIIWPKLLVAPIWVIVLRTGHTWRPASFPGARQAFIGWRQIARFSVSVLGVEAMTVAQANVDNLIVGYFLGFEALGVYYFAFNAGLGVSLGLINAFSTVIYTQLCQANTGAGALAASFRRTRQTLGLLVVPTIALQTLAAPFYVPLVFGSKWTPAIPVLMIICLSALARPFAAATTQLLRAANQPGVELRWQAMLTGILIVALLLSAHISLLAVSLSLLLVQSTVLGAFAVIVPRKILSEGRSEVAPNIQVTRACQRTQMNDVVERA